MLHQTLNGRKFSNYQDKEKLIFGEYKGENFAICFLEILTSTRSDFITQSIIFPTSQFSSISTNQK